MSSNLFDFHFSNTFYCSKIVVDKMRLLHPEMTWLEMDFTKMIGIASGSFHFVLDKSAMDSLVADSGDPWNPSEDTVEVASRMISEIVRVLVSL